MDLNHSPAQHAVRVPLPLCVLHAVQSEIHLFVTSSYKASL